MIECVFPVLVQVKTIAVEIVICAVEQVSVTHVTEPVKQIKFGLMLSIKEA